MLLVAAVVVAGGCTTARVTDPARTATEQFLMSTAGELAVAQLSVEPLRGRRVYVDATYFAAAEQQFVIGELRAHLLMNGILLVPSRDQAEIILEARSGGVGIDRYEFLLGIPSIPIGTAMTAVGLPPSPVNTPELALVKNLRQWGFASVAIVAYWADTGELVASSGPFIGRTRREDWWFFGGGPRAIGNVPTIQAPE